MHRCLYIYVYIFLNKSSRQHTTKQLYGHLPPVSKTIKIRRTRHAGQRELTNLKKTQQRKTPSIRRNLQK